MSANIPNDPVAIQRFFTSRDNNADAATYVGQEQRLWYDPTTNAIYVSDGNTAGGVMVGAGGSGNGVPGGPTNSIQYNAGSGNFGGSSNFTFDGSNVTITGNISGDYILGNGSQLTDLPVQPGTYGNSNVAAYLPTYSGNISGGNIGLSGNLNAVGDITSFANIVVSSGGYFQGDGSQLTNLPVQPGTYGNSNVSTFLGTFGSNTISTTGNVSGGHFTLTGDTILNNITDTITLQTGSDLWTFGTNGVLTAPGNISAVGNITGNYFIGDGSQLTNVPGGASNKIVNGNSYANIASTDGNLVVNVGNDGYGLWTFETGSGNLIGPGNVTQGAGIVLSADQNVYIREDMGQLAIDAVSNIVITSNAGNTGNTRSWNFDPNGNLTAPGNIYLDGDLNSIVDKSTNGIQLFSTEAAQLNYNDQQYIWAASSGINFSTNAASTWWTINLNANLIAPNIATVDFNTNSPNVLLGNVANVHLYGGSSDQLLSTNGAGSLTWVTGYGNSNVATFLADFGSNTISTSGNITGNFFIGDGSQLTNLPVGNYSNTNVAAYLTTANISTTGNIDANNIATGLITITDLYSPNFYSNAIIYSNSAGYISSTNLFKYNPGTGTLTVDAASLTGNVTANYFIGDGSQLTNLPVGNYSNSNVTSFLADFGSNAISTSGNITGNYFIGDGSQLTNLPVQPGTYGNANVADYLPTYTGNLTSGEFSSTGNVVAGGNVTGGNFSTTGNILGAGDFSVTGNAVASNISTTGNISVAGNIILGADVSATGNIIGNYVLGNGSQLTNLPVQPGTYGNSNVATFLGDFGSNTISTSGNITGNYILGDGSQLTNLPTGNYSNSNVATFLGDFGSNVISTSGNITASGLLIDTVTGITSNAGNININQITGLGGYLNAFGANLLGNINAANLSLSGNIINDANISGNVNAANISASNISLSGNIFAYGANIYSVNGLTMEGGNLTMSSITGLGGSISAEGNIIGANLSATSNVSGQNINSGNLSLSGNVISDLNIQQGNISVSGNITSGSELTVVSANITGAMGLTVSGGDITIPASMSGGSLSAYGNITGNYIIGDGSQLTNLPVQPGTYGNSNVATFLGDFGSNTISTSGDITGASLNTAGAGGDLVMSNGDITGARRVVTTPTALANLTAVAGGRAFVNDGNLVAVGNFGSQIGTGGSNVVPVWSDGANWYIG